MPSDLSTPKPKSNMAFAAFLPLIETAVGGVLSLFGKNAEVDKAKNDLLVAQNNLKIAQTQVDISKEGTKQELIKLAEAKEITAQKALEEQNKSVRQKQSIGALTLIVVLVLVFGLAWLFVKFVLPVLFPKPEVQPQNVVIQDE